MANIAKEWQSSELTLAAIDALRLDGQSRTPNEADGVKMVAEEFVDGMLYYWGKFIDRQTQIDAKLFPCKILFTQGKDFKEFDNNFEASDETTASRASDYKLRVFCIEECGANWYSHDVLSKKGRIVTLQRDERELVEYYAQLIKIHGDAIHQYHFGTLDNRSVARKIINSVDLKMVKKLFGNSYDEMWGGYGGYTPDCYGKTYTDQGLIVVKSGVKMWQQDVQYGQESRNEMNLSRLTKWERLMLTSFDNLTIGHEITHMFYDVARSNGKRK